MQSALKILVLLTSHRHVEELDLLDRAVRLCCPRLASADVLLHSTATTPTTVRQLLSFTELSWLNKTFVNSPRNEGGHAWGPVNAVAAMWPLARQYDVVIHQHPDVFWTNETFLDEALASRADYGIVATTAFNYGPPHLAFDVFAVFPRALRTNIFHFAVQPDFNTFPPEEYLHATAQEHDVRVRVVPRFDTGSWSPRRIDMLGLWHEHELHKVAAYLAAQPAPPDGDTGDDDVID